MAANLNEILQGIVQDLSGSLGIGVVDIGTGMAMGIHHVVPHFTQNFIDAASAGSVDMYRGKNIRRIEENYCELRGIPYAGPFIQEIFFMTEKTYHFSVAIADKNAIVMLITTKSVNQGMAWSSLRSNLDKIRKALP